MKRISISEEEFQAVMDEILSNIKVDSEGDVILVLMTEAFGKMVKDRLFDGRFEVVSEDANTGKEERKSGIQKMVEASVREAFKKLGM